MSDLPVGWADSFMGDVAELSLGKMLDAKQATGLDPTPYLRNVNVRWGAFELDDLAAMDIRPDELERVLARRGDVIVCEGGEPGRSAVWSGAPVAIQKALHRLRPRQGMNSSFLAMLLRHQAASGELGGLFTGTTIKHLPKEKLQVVRVLCPPTAEQERIVAAIEEAFSKLDAGEAALRATRQRLKRLRESVLSAAVTGRLVPQDPTDEPASKLLADVGVIPADDGGGFVVPSGWAVSRVGDVADVALGRQRHPDWHDGPNMKPYLRVANVFEDRIDTRDVKQMHFDADAFERFKLVVGDVLLNEGQTPELLGRPAIYRGEPPEVAFTNSILRFKAKAGINPEWALLVFRHYMRTGRFTRESRITTNIAHLSAGRLKPIEFPVPPTNEQGLIVMEVERQFSFIDACERTVGVGLARSAALRRSILKSAFEGKLVPQDPTDEPASVLLARTRAERDAVGKAPKPCRTSKVASST